MEHLRTPKSDCGLNDIRLTVRISDRKDRARLFRPSGALNLVQTARQSSDEAAGRPDRSAPPTVGLQPDPCNK